MFEKYSRKAGKEQYLIPYFIAAHPGTTDEDMMYLAIWLKQNGFRADQVQTFYPSPMATATAMYHSGKNPLRKIGRDTEEVETVRKTRQRRLHKAFLRYHDPDNEQGAGKNTESPARRRKKVLASTTRKNKFAGSKSRSKR